MQIEFRDGAFESFQDALDRLPEYGVEITTEEGETFDAILLGANREAEWGDTALFIRVKGGNYVASDYPSNLIESARVEKVVVH